MKKLVHKTGKEFVLNDQQAEWLAGHNTDYTLVEIEKPKKEDPEAIKNKILSIAPKGNKKANG